MFIIINLRISLVFIQILYHKKTPPIIVVYGTVTKVSGILEK